MKAPESISWYLHRLRAMGPVEVGHRLHQKWLLQTEPAFLESLSGLYFTGTAQPFPSLPNPDEAPPGLRACLAQEAKRLQSGQWRLFGWREADVGSPPCWHRDPCCGVVVDPNLPSQKLNHRQLPDGADARSIWEINRWAEVTQLGMHAWLNEDLEALKTAQSWLLDWTERNPPGQGINWTSPLEVAIRLINLAWFDALVTASLARDANAKIQQAQEDLVRVLVPAHTAWIWRYRSNGSSANNHLLGELAALVVAAARWPALERLACSAPVAWEKLEAELLRQFAPDGGSREQALHYHLFAFELAWVAARSAEGTGGAGYERLCKAAAFFEALVHELEPWDFGDNDDAQVLPLTGDRARAIAEWKAWMNGQDGSLRFWLGTPPACDFAVSEEVVKIFPDCGMGVLKKAGWKARLDASPLGFGSLAAHGHADALHLSLWDGDNALLIDPGTGGYYGYPQWRGKLAAWESHNGPVPLNGFETPVRMGPFLWTRPHLDPAMTQLANGLQATFRHEGYVFSRSVQVTEGEVRVLDEELNRQPFQVRLIFAPECEIRQEPDGSLTVIRLRKVWSFRCESENCLPSLGEIQVSPAYGMVEPATCVVFSASQGRLDLCMRRSLV